MFQKGQASIIVFLSYSSADFECINNIIAVIWEVALFVFMLL